MIVDRNAAKSQTSKIVVEAASAHEIEIASAREGELAPPKRPRQLGRLAGLYASSAQSDLDAAAEIERLFRGED